MTRSKRLQPVQNLADDAERRLAQSLAQFERRVSDGEAKLQELERYRGEYEKQFTQSAGKGIAVTNLRDYQVFLARLSEAIKQQQSLVQRARMERDAERLRWQGAAKRVKALDHVVEQWNAEEVRIKDRSEQREIDERGQRKGPSPRDETES
jgi:flagellar protein FliJ